MAQARTRKQVRYWFEVSGVSVSDWARDQGLPVSVVYALLAGRTRGRRGKAHRAAVALGMKPKIPSMLSELNGPTSVALSLCARNSGEDSKSMT